MAPKVTVLGPWMQPGLPGVVLVSPALYESEGMFTKGQSWSELYDGPWVLLALALVLTTRTLGLLGRLCFRHMLHLRLASDLRVFSLQVMQLENPAMGQRQHPSGDLFLCWLRM